DRLLLLAHLVLLRFGVSDRGREPLRVGRERRLRAEGDGLRVAVGYPRDAQLVVAVRPVDAVGEPLPIWREPPAIERQLQALPLAEVGRRRRRQRRRLPAPRRSSGREPDTEQRRKRESGESHLNISFGNFTCTPTLPSTSCVIATFPATLVSW